MAARKLIHLPGVAGADEAGRGPLAGPVVVAAVVLPKGFRVSGIDDSKKLTPERREHQAERIKERAAWCVEVVGVDEIDRYNILWASMLGMARALERLSFSRALVDGNCLPRTTLPVEAVVKGDGKYACIAAASIIAKTERDRIMREVSLEYPEYGFDSHFGYSTPEHLAALDRFGPCPLHRRSFTRISDLVNQPCLTFDE
jgi:ribonuclease HII